MAAAAIVEGSKRMQRTNAGLIETVQIKTVSDGETAVTYPFRGTKILSAFVTGNQAGKYGPFAVPWTDTTVSLAAEAGAAGDNATVGLTICGY